jgi:hypothetical protein
MTGPTPTSPTAIATASSDPAHQLVAERLAEEMAAISGSRKRILAAECEAALIEVEPALEWEPSRRARLADALSELEAAGTIAWSTKRDRTLQPELPAFVTLSAAPPPPRPTGPRYLAWRPELAWAHDLSLTASEVDDLQQIQAFLKDQPDISSKDDATRDVPHRERSLEIFGDEKRLDRLTRGRLFEPGRLTLELLSCRWAPPPISYAPAMGRSSHPRSNENGPIVLVSENAAGYHSLLAHIPPPVTHVAYGGGGQFALTVAGLVPLGPTSILYIGDLDAEGLAIPQRAIAQARAFGLPEPTPAEDLWRSLCLLAVRFGQPAQSVPEDVATELCSWFKDPGLATDVAAVLVAGRRVAQESIGTDYLLAGLRLTQEA